MHGATIKIKLRLIIKQIKTFCD